MPPCFSMMVFDKRSGEKVATSENYLNESESTKRKILTKK